MKNKKFNKINLNSNKNNKFKKIIFLMRKMKKMKLMSQRLLIINFNKDHQNKIVK